MKADKLTKAARTLGKAQKQVVKNCLHCGGPMVGVARKLRHPSCCQQAAYLRRKARGYYAAKTGAKPT